MAATTLTFWDVQNTQQRKKKSFQWEELTLWERKEQHENVYLLLNSWQ